jgi:biotin carboxyl carrier protein
MTTDKKKITSEESAGKSAKKGIQLKTINVGEADYQTSFTKKYENRKKWQKPDPRQIISFIPGTVKDIYVGEGTVVKKGDELLILEAMKMLNKIEVSMNGKIRKIYIKSGDKIPKGFLMMELE